jgi:carboxyl-terminal processing protease
MENLEYNPQPNNVPPKSRPTGRRIFGAILIIMALVASFRLGYTSGSKGYVFEPKSFSVINQSEAPVTVDYNLLWDALDMVNKKYIDKDSINQQDVLYGAIRGAVAAAGDDYTEFFDPKELEEFNTQLGGSFDGIGAEVGKKDNNIVIITPLDDSPASRAGVRAKDIIVKINGESTAEMTVDEAVGKIRGQRGTTVTLTLYREGQTQTFDVTIKREKIDVKSVKLTYQTVNDKKIAIIELSRFGTDTSEAFAKAVNDLLVAGAKGVVVDQRNNPGGYLDVSVDLASYWLPKGQLVVTEARSDKDSQPYNSSGYGRLSGLKTVVIMNGGSASAAEILAGALHDHGVATLVGEKSFGKGSVQQLFTLPDNKSAVKITVAKWITPNGKNLNKDGLVPDIEVKLTDDDIAAGRDPQLAKAVEEAAK